MKLETIEATTSPALTASELVLAKRGHMSSATFSARGGECRLYGGEVREIHFSGPAATVTVTKKRKYRARRAHENRQPMEPASDEGVEFLKGLLASLGEAGLLMEAAANLHLAAADGAVEDAAAAVAAEWAAIAVW